MRRHGGGDSIAVAGGRFDALAPLLPRPFRIGAVALCGEDTERRFHQVARDPLAG